MAKISILLFMSPIEILTDIALSGNLRCSSSALCNAVASTTSTYVALFLKPVAFTPGYRCYERMLEVAEHTGAVMLYADRWEQRADAMGKLSAPQLHPVIDYQEGALRDDFDFGGLWLVRGDLLREYVATTKSSYQHAAIYDLRLFLGRKGEIIHLREPLYTETENDLRKSGERQFDYVNPNACEVQKEMEDAVTHHLKAIGAWVPVPVEVSMTSDAECSESFSVEASVIIPVRNRVSTITDAVQSALQQTTDFVMNVIVVDNHSTDGTGEAVRAIDDPRVICIVPERNDLGIGGCWDLAIRSPHCGRYAIQLDSDDLYSGTDTLQRIVNKFKEEHAAMVIGAYSMVDFNLRPLPPGLIAHTEWTTENGRNNALRVNGLGAPRAFDTAILRKIGFPNTSYGEDYAVGLAISRSYHIARIYDELYLCRRWKGNSDAVLSVEKENAHNTYKDSLRTIELRIRKKMMSGKVQRHFTGIYEMFQYQMKIWDACAVRYESLQTMVQTRQLHPLLTVQHNPARINSTGVDLSKATLANRACFLCSENRPYSQVSMPYGNDFEILVNPFPILSRHYTIPLCQHKAQEFRPFARTFLELVKDFEGDLVFYNGARCGASAPDHLHFQAGTADKVPLIQQWDTLETTLISKIGDTEISTIDSYLCPAFSISGLDFTEIGQAIETVIAELPGNNDSENPDYAGNDSGKMFNIIGWSHTESLLPVSPDTYYTIVVFPRYRHRPACYFSEGNAHYTISPGALDMAGLMITPQKEDFERITLDVAQNILREVSISEEEMSDVVKRIKAASR